MGIEKDLERALEERYWVEIATTNHFSTYGKIKEVEKGPDGAVRFCPYIFSITPYAEKGSTEFYFKEVEDKAIAVKKRDIAIIIPIPDEAMALVKEVAQRFLKERMENL